MKMIPIMLGVFAIIFVVSMLSKERAVVKRKLKKFKRQSIADVAEGENAKIVGRIQHVDNLINSPLTNRQCVHYHVKVEQRKNDEDSSNWAEVLSRKESSRILIHDKTGYALVETNSLRSVISKDKNFSSGFLNDPSPTLKAFLDENGLKAAGMLGFNKSYRYEEGILEVNEEIVALGKGSWKKASEYGLENLTDQILVISRMEKDHAYITDDDNLVSSSKTWPKPNESTTPKPQPEPAVTKTADKEPIAKKQKSQPETKEQDMEQERRLDRSEVRSAKRKERKGRYDKG